MIVVVTTIATLVWLRVAPDIVRTAGFRVAAAIEFARIPLRFRPPLREPLVPFLKWPRIGPKLRFFTALMGLGGIAVSTFVALVFFHGVLLAMALNLNVWN